MCIDDFAFKKRHNYGTIMVDIDTHRIIDIIPSREIEDVTKWLSTFPNLEIVSRDGSVSYNSAIKHANEAIIQISDRGASSTIRMFATRERKLIKEAKKNSQGKTEKIERKWLISLLYKPIDKVKKISQEQFDKVMEKYPEIGEIYDIVGAFKNTLFSKEPEDVEKWMEDAEALVIESINSFVNGIRRDLKAVKKAVELDYNNGLAEGSLNKLKVTKRIMYGRNSFELLKGKLLRLELKRKIN